jgi:hypothetical protein
LAAELAEAGLSFAGYSEGLPSPGFRGCWSGRYARKHAPWTEFPNLPPATNLPFSAMPAYEALPTVSFVIPNLDNDMHDGTIAQGDAWLRDHIGPLVEWAFKNDTLVIVTWDETEGYDLTNRIATIFAGPMVKPGTYNERVTHYNVLRTIEDMYGLPHAGRSGSAAPIEDCWL